MLKYSELKKLRRYYNFESLNLKDCSEVKSADPTILYPFFAKDRESCFFKYIFVKGTGEESTGG
jgi:hypothetical protein